MRCRICKQKASIYLREHRLSLCKNDFIERFYRLTEERIEKFKMFSKEDKILVAISGGKDSMVLTYVLKKLGYNITALHIDLGIEKDNYSRDSLEKCTKLTDRLDIPLIVINVKKETKRSAPYFEKNRSFCSSCGLVKRYYMNRVALERNFDVVATGHNLDDSVAQLLGNVLKWDAQYMAKQYPVLEKDDGFVKRVKPFTFFTEKEDLAFALLEKIDFYRKECPYSQNASSIFYKKIISELEERSPGIKYQFYSKFLQFTKKYLNEEKLNLRRCKTCGAGTILEECVFCRTLKRIKKDLKKS